MKKKASLFKNSSYSQYMDSFPHSGIVKDFSHYVKTIKKNAYFSKLLNALPFAMSITDYQTQKYLYVNETAGEELTGYPIQEFIDNGMPYWLSLIHHDDLLEISNHSFPELLASLHKLTAEEVKQCKFTYTYRMKRKDNKWIHVLQNSVILEMDEKRNPLLVLTTVSDITLYKKDDTVIFTLSHYDKPNGIMNMITQTLNSCKKTTEREKEIIRYIANGIIAKEIAKKMHLSINTINAHKRNIFEKTNTKNIAELTSYAFANSIV